MMEEVETLRTFVFVTHEYVQHAGRELRGNHCIPNRSYLVLENHDRPDAIGFVYGDSMALGSRKAAMSLQKGPDKQAGDSEENMMMRGGSE